MLASNVIYKAVYQRLTSAEATAANGGTPIAVYDHMPTEAAYPFIVMEEHDSEQFNSDDSEGTDMTLYMDLWSQYPGMKEVQALGDIVHDVCDRREVDYATPGYLTVVAEIIRDTATVQSDGITHLMRIELRVVIDRVA